MKKTVEGKVLKVGVADWWLQGNGLVVGLELSDAPLRNGDHVEVTWDEQTPGPPCEHVTWNNKVGKWHFADIDDWGYVNYCPECGVELSHA